MSDESHAGLSPVHPDHISANMSTARTKKRRDALASVDRALSSQVAPKNAKLPKLSRAERAIVLKERILRAAAIVVGKLGYQDAAIAKITQLAGIAQGTFYLYFGTRQELFDVLLPHAGQDMMQYIGTRVKGASSFLEVEERGVRAFFDYLKENPGFYRLLNEAEFAAPIAHRRHMAQLVDHYVASLSRSCGEGRLSQFSDDEFKTIAYTAMAARSYLYLAFVKYGDVDSPPDTVVETYMRLIWGDSSA